MQAPAQHHPVIKSFHWLVVALLAVEFAAGWLMPDLRRGVTPAGLLSFHMSFGVVILAVMFARLMWRLGSRVPIAEPASPWWQELAAQWTHYLLYIFTILLPVSGLWIASTHGWSVNVFGIGTLQPLVTPDANMTRLADLTHIAIITVVLALIAAHVAAALYHYFILKDTVLQRMLPGKNY